MTPIAGDYPGRVRIVVSEGSGNDQLGLLWGIRCRHYSSANTARLAYAATDLEPLDAATVVGTTIAHTNLGTDWAPVCSTNLTAGTAFMTHTGSYRVWLTAAIDTDADVSVRLVWDVGDLASPVENRPVAVPNGGGSSYVVDLGEVRLDRVPVGAHRWQGQIQARGGTGGEDLTLHRLNFQPLDEGAGRLVANPISVQGLEGYSIRDDFLQTSGNLEGKTVQFPGGTWDQQGAPDAFDIDATNDAARRINMDDPANVPPTTPIVGAWALAGTTDFTDVLVEATVNLDSFPVDELDGFLRAGVAARYVDPAHNLQAYLHVHRVGVTPRFQFQVAASFAGDANVIDSFVCDLAEDQDYTIRLQVNRSGAWYAWMFPAGAAAGDPKLSGFSPELAGGGLLENGQAGLYDAGFVGGADNRARRYKHFSVRVPTPDAVIFANRSAELRTDGCYRETEDGTGWGPAGPPIGTLPRIPPSGLENRPVELLVMPSTGDFDQLPHQTGGTVSAQVFYRPSWVTFPG